MIWECGSAAAHALESSGCRESPGKGDSVATHAELLKQVVIAQLILIVISRITFMLSQMKRELVFLKIVVMSLDLKE